jgi:small subunit ribosomal protein S17
MKKEITKITKKREIEGIVVSNKMTGTVRVEIEEVRRHSEYDKVIRRQKSFFAHTNEALNIGDKVTIRESKPFSKNVTWVVVNKQ